MSVPTTPDIGAQFRDFSPTYISAFETLSGESARRTVPNFATGVAYLPSPFEGGASGYTMTQFGVWQPIDDETDVRVPNKTLLEFDSAIPMADDRARRVVLLLRKGFDREARSGLLEVITIDQTKSPRIGGEILTENDIPNVYRLAKLPPEKLSLFFKRALQYVEWCASDDFPKGKPYQY